jgi:hypothetical protein
LTGFCVLFAWLLSCQFRTTRVNVVKYSRGTGPHCCFQFGLLPSSASFLPRPGLVRRRPADRRRHHGEEGQEEAAASSSSDDLPTSRGSPLPSSKRFKPLPRSRPSSTSRSPPRCSPPCDYRGSRLLRRVGGSAAEQADSVSRPSAQVGGRRRLVLLRLDGRLPRPREGVGAASCGDVLHPMDTRCMYYPFDRPKHSHSIPDPGRQRCSPCFQRPCQHTDSAGSSHQNHRIPRSQRRRSFSSRDVALTDDDFSPG